ncbi:hypothetical protein [Hyalangium rubrum]|uniref:Lipoprotein n=1 Tax=Hyalangium rubrum TaxID=3103134 RepID=A0ABU5H9B6_9BACT|nr:hypothetical protein [Hyalangium sp. s54d21]MDY7230075.1 hypothetical protein [Hyalangium sp. s54d21]
MTTRQRILWSVCASTLLLGSACGKEEEPTDKCGEPLYGGSATDEAWMTMVDAQSKAADASRAVSLMSPTEGETFAADAAAPRFSWTSPLRASLERDTPSRYALAHPRASKGVFSWLGELLVPTAEAHLPPFTGDIYFVEVSVPGRECPLQVLTSELAWQVDAESWKTMGDAAGKDLKLQVTSAYLQDNRLKEGPFRLATPRVFRRAAATP